MYHIHCDDYPLFDPRDDGLIVESPKVNLEVNTVGEGSFTIHQNHPYYGKLMKLKSVFEISDEIGVIFRGRMTNNSYDFYNSKFVDLEGAMAYFNDSVVRPYVFPDDFVVDADYITAAESGNVIQFFLKWLIDNHNKQVEEFQRFKLGRVTVTDPNNYLSRSDSTYPNTWETLKSKLFDSALGGYLCIRYEADGNYIDYLSEFELTNTQEIVFGENLLGLKTDSDATTTYSAVIPIGATIETESTDDEGKTVTKKTIVGIESLPDGDITDDIVKEGDMIYSRSARAEYGLIIAPVKETTWDDVTDARNLLTKSVNFLAAVGMMLSETVEATAADLHFSDEQIQSFRIYRNVKVRSDPHGHNGIYQLSKLGLDLQNPQNTKIAVGSTKRTLTDINADQKADYDTKIESTKNELKEYVSNKTTQLDQKIVGLDGLFFYVKYSAYADGHVMTDTPQADTMYMGTCSAKLKQNVAPTDHSAYTWVRIRGEDGQNGIPGVDGTDGQSQYFHVKYSDDGKTFTANGGETLGKWLGTCVDNNEADPTDFNAYTWRKIVGEDGEPGIDGKDGQAGKSCYFYVKFSANADGNPMSETPDSNTKYMGVCSTTSATAPTNYADYTWTQCRGNDGTNGIPGVAGADGKTQYLHIKYSNDGQTFTDNNGEDLGAWIGTLVDFTEADSTTFSDYTWKKFTEDVEEELNDIRQTITDKYTEAVSTSEEITLRAVEKLVEKSVYDEFLSTLEAEMKVWAGGIAGRVSATEQEIKDVDGDLQEKFNTITKYFTFDINGLTIGQVDNPNKVVIDNDQISILVNNVPVQEFKADGTALIPILKITQILNLFGLQITEDASHINCDYVGV